jgi:hypothetical protein
MGRWIAAAPRLRAGVYDWTGNFPVRHLTHS